MYKNKWLMLNRGISFKEIADVILSGNIIEILENPARNNQQYLLIDIKSYTWVVPFLINKDEQIMLKTAFPSRKFHKKYGEKMERNKLTEEEKLIENDIDKLKPVSGEKKAKIKKILAGARKSRSISLRISVYDLDKLKEKAERTGIPYQTLINSILHKYLTNQLLEEDEILKALSFGSNADLK